IFGMFTDARHSTSRWITQPEPAVVQAVLAVAPEVDVEEQAADAEGLVVPADRVRAAKLGRAAVEVVPAVVAVVPVAELKQVAAVVVLPAEEVEAAEM